MSPAGTVYLVWQRQIVYDEREKSCPELVALFAIQDDASALAKTVPGSWVNEGYVFRDKAQYDTYRQQVKRDAALAKLTTEERALLGLEEER